MSHLCTMHRPPPSKEWTGGDHFGEFMEVGTPTLPLQSTGSTSASPSTLWWPGGDTFKGGDTLHVTVLFEEEEFSTHRSSGLCFRDRQHVRAEFCSRVAYFLGLCPHSGLVLCRGFKPDQKMLLCGTSGHLCRWR